MVDSRCSVYMARPGAGPCLSAGGLFVVGFSEDQVPMSCSHVVWGSWRGPALVPMANGKEPVTGGGRAVGGGGGEPAFLGSPVSSSLDTNRSFVVGLGWTLLFAQRGGARVAPQALTERSGQEGKGQRSGSVN